MVCRKSQMFLNHQNEFDLCVKGQGQIYIQSGCIDFIANSFMFMLENRHVFLRGVDDK